MSATALPFAFSPPELQFLLHAAGGETVSLTRPGATALTGEGVLALRGRLAAIAATEGAALVSLADLTPDQRADILAHLAGISDGGPEYYDSPKGGWCCFHCGERFRTVAGARLHFGAEPTETAACLKPHEAAA